ncbi:MAG TPA: TolC family protein [Bryobacteraceae bacterium]|nr:TolC family protein [Bryobacteraceae bacterium]
MNPRKLMAIALCLTSLTWAQQIGPVRPQAPVMVRPYLPVTVPSVRLENSSRLQQLIRAGMLYLTAQDAIALVLENNIDLEVSRYNPFISEWNLERAEAGGALPGVPSGASQAGSVASGQGVLGSQSAAGVTAPGASLSKGGTTNATISQIGPVTPNLDPIVQETTSFAHTSSPQVDSVQSQVANLIQATHVYTGSYQQGVISGGVVSVNYSEHYLNENAPSDVLNPSVAPSLGISIQHNFLRGFGAATNARTITVSRMNLNTTELNFKNQVMGLVSQVLNLYYGLAADYEDLRAKRTASETAQTFLKDVRRQIEIGSEAPSDVITAESQAESASQAVSDADATLRQQELSLENLITRTGTADPLLANVRIIPMDSVTVPPADSLPPVDQMVRQALANRPDLAAELASEKANQINSLGTKNGILPTLQGIAVTSQAGLAGTPRTVTFDGFTEHADPRFKGGIGTALGQVFHRDFATDVAGVFYQSPIRNRQAQADYAIDQLQLRQTQLTNRKDFSQVEVDVRNGVVALEQARARLEAAQKNRELEQQLYDGEAQRFRLGASTPYNVAVQQRDLINAQSTELAAKVAYVNARIGLDQTLGATLEVNHVTLEEAKSGKISRPSTAP